MAIGKRQPIHTSSGGSTTGSSSPLGGSFRLNHMNFRPPQTQPERGRGTKPTPLPSSVGLILATMLIHLCRKSLLFDPRLKVTIYCGAIFVVSIIADVATMPRTYFSRSDNFLNQYFVKFGWGWLCAVTIPWITLTAHTLGCGKHSIVVKHLCRLLVATCAFILWIRLFTYIENNYGRCLNTKDPNLRIKTNCLQAGKFWRGFDISGHAFILIYSSLILAEEGIAIVGWEGIKDLIAKEEHARKTPNEISTGNLKNLSSEDLKFLKNAHKGLSPYIRGLFVMMTLQQLLWDVMLVATILYYHIMLEKIIGGIVAIITWYATYQWWFRCSNGGLCAPGQGSFTYSPLKDHQDIGVSKTRRNTLNGTGPTFMGLPIRTPQETTANTANVMRPVENDLSASRTA